MDLKKALQLLQAPKATKKVAAETFFYGPHFTATTILSKKAWKSDKLTHTYISEGKKLACLNDIR